MGDVRASEALPAWATAVVWPTTGAARNRPTRLVAFPNAASPQQLLPQRLGSVKAAFARRSDDRGPQRCLRDAAATLAAVCGGGALTGRSVRVDGVERSLTQHVAESLDIGAKDAVVLSGPARANQKPVLQLLTSSGSTLAFVKVGWNELTKRLLREERTHLEAIHGSLPVSVRVPRVLGSGSFHDADWLALSPVGVDRREAPTGAQVTALARLVEAVLPLSPTDGYVDGLLERTADLVRTQSAATIVRDLHGDRIDTAGCWHGDFVPWNIATGRGQWALWDWERFRVGVPLGFDRFHHRFNVSLHRRGLATADAVHDLIVGAADTLPELDHATAVIHARWYLVEILGRYEHDAMLGGPGADHLLRRVDELGATIRSSREN